MSGIFVLFVLGLFVTVLHFVKRWLFGRYDDKLNSLSKRLVASVVFWVLAFTLPIADEIVGGFQFRALCQENAKLQIDAENIKGKIVKIVVNPRNEVLNGTAVDISHWHYSYRDIENNGEYARYDTYIAYGGWLIRNFWFRGTMIIHPYHCGPTENSNIDEFAKLYQFFIVQ